MNAAARLLHQSTVSRSWVISTFFSKTHFMLSVLVVAVLISGLSMVYVTHATRSMHASIQQMLAERQRMHIEWGQLLLQKSTWTTQARVQQQAEHDLNMVVPDQKSVVIVNE